MLAFTPFVALALAGSSSAATFGTHLALRSTPSSNNVIAQMFEWPWTSIATECTDYLGPFGYGYVQVSPPMEHITGTQWWCDYQPVSYTLTSRRGTEAEFASMVSTCADAGVGIIVDAVTNHMTAGSGTGFAGNTYSKYDYPAVPYTSSSFHYCNGANGAKDISNYDNATDVWFCELDSLADLAQEESSVRDSIAGYLQNLLDIGVAGFRLDAAKSIPPANISAILGSLSGSYYDTQEVYYGAGEAVSPADYVGNGDVIEFRVPETVLTYFTSQGIANMVTPSPMGSAWGFIDSDVANSIVANQDTERSATSLNYESANNAYVLSAIFILSFNYGGAKTVYSGYNFTSYDQGAPQDSNGNTNAVTCDSNGWRCEHRWQAIANMVGFNNAVGQSSALTNIQEGTNNQIAFGRGSIGFVAINNAASSWSATFSTSLPDGTYCDIIHDTDTDPTVCSSTTYTVSGGSFTATVGAYDAIAIYTSSGSSIPTSTTSTSTAPTSTSATVSITFDELETTSFGENVYLVGSIAALGSWNTASAILLSAAQYTSSNPLWSVTVTLPSSTAFEYKFFKKESDGSIVWESDPNRSYTTSSSGSATVSDSWR
ncbi:alpha-amylase [Stereum hirsutum FP-91666 SS1]|uniref:alpha-amylase n=1 Tax=Stereum hirsutum (strain FP-91666) TaxID=721885 RepID=UPI000440C529|nr:alpha-amylase [Stereum hirsutum FP-91666 SS1]EIM87674.1 alpha-amylase [Stereum hirsutum FP-91666 SS1]